MRKRWLSALHNLAVDNLDIVFIGSDLSADPALINFQNAIGNRFLMEGISEANIIGMASGLAQSGFIVYVNTIATFITRRCFEQNVIDLGLSNANVRLIGGGGGLVYAPLGPTHLAIEDLALMQLIPNMSVVIPCDANQMEKVIKSSVIWSGPMYIRVAKGGEPTVSDPTLEFTIGKAIVHREGSDILLATYGTMLHTCLVIADELKTQNISVGVIEFHTLKPFDRSKLVSEASKYSAMITVEEHLIQGGLGSLVAETLAETPELRSVKFKRLGLPDAFPDVYGSQDSLKAKYGLSRDKIYETMLSFCSI